MGSNRNSRTWPVCGDRREKTLRRIVSQSADVDRKQHGEHAPRRPITEVEATVGDNAEPEEGSCIAGQREEQVGRRGVRNGDRVARHTRVFASRLLSRSGGAAVCARCRKRAEPRPSYDASRRATRERQESLRSLMLLLRARHCPYFYVCAATFTALFRAAATGGATYEAVLTPTTSGFREALRKGGVNFTMPLNKSASGWESVKKNSTSERSPSLITQEGATADQVAESKEELQKEASCNNDDLDSHPYDMDLDAIELTTGKLKVQGGKSRKVDLYPESTVKVEGRDCQALYNYLLNSKSCVSNAGHQAGLPPTLLAPVAFHGATLDTLKVQHGSVRQAGGALYTLQLTGALLPSAVNGLCRLVAATQGGATFAATTVPRAGPHDAAQPRGRARRRSLPPAQRRDAAVRLRDRRGSGCLAAARCGADVSMDAHAFDLVAAVSAVHAAANFGMSEESADRVCRRASRGEPPTPRTAVRPGDCL
ncbi:PREDICTED: protein downstream neighbor of son homolog [Priapulus caudatus]|uniref:Protein downstream neighbor of son homolog n=1 Tax=Priapulus caudatus TaxID=37621 RepID=A0ABM1EX77_PRICU|nr:PREDICTED: protein downstream neighbor of son homolog [Priapulus caudatus]